MTGAAVARFGPHDASGAWICFVGGLFFTTGGCASLLQAIDAPPRFVAGGMLRFFEHS
ncbi:hypothetical protein ABZ172_14675 [Streptomyces sp. NPDC006296]|uniref:hypothetical protein n=1 Tax=Streptomyces sp. NPDC006296 TaxID=3156746 RepID=UPI0033A02954